MDLCQCGCGQEVTKEGNKFLRFHHLNNALNLMKNLKNRQALSKRNINNKWHLGNKHSEETKEHFSKIRRGKNKGKDNPSWKGGHSLKYNSEFCHIKENIRIRDNYLCQVCFTNKNLETHHIDYNKRNDEKKNLITLCVKCHNQAHLKNINKQKVIEYYTKILEK